MKAFAIKDPFENLLMTSIRSDKDACINSFARYNWHIQYSSGYRCVPVLITEAKTDK